MQRFFCLLFAVTILLTQQGCAVFMAATQPDYKNMNVLEKGTPRANVVAELGQPVLTGEKNGKKSDVFSFVQGYGKGNKACRALFHGAADVFSLGLWEVIGTPAESIAKGRKTKVEVIYDSEDRVEQATFLTGNK
ncbi:MAG: hypothetical protein V1709_08295 [Planctomycetota bacterium]